LIEPIHEAVRQPLALARLLEGCTELGHILDLA
jgi:hypothetical protein